MPSELAKAAIRLTPAERIALVGEIWDSLVEEGSPPPLTEAQSAELRAREARFDRDGSNGTSWATIRNELNGRPRR
jgi:putative addiction module component (TIGR02574 family)